MEKQLLPALAVLVFCVLYTAAIAAQTKSQISAASPDKTRTEVHRLGFGKRVKLRLQNGTKVRGRITGLADDQFVVTDSETGLAMKVAYVDVAVIRKQREVPRMFKGAFTGIALTAAVVGTLCVITLALLD
jgi:hypothetical protein